MLFREQNSIKLVLRGHKNLNQSAFRQKAVFIDEKSAEGEEALWEEKKKKELFPRLWKIVRLGIR